MYSRSGMYKGQSENIRWEIFKRGAILVNRLNVKELKSLNGDQFKLILKRLFIQECLYSKNEF